MPTNEGQRLDHTTKLEASLRRQCGCHSIGDRGEPALGTSPALPQGSLTRLVRSDWRGDRGEPALRTAPALLRASKPPRGFNLHKL
jgi:hypothetical protein